MNELVTTYTALPNLHPALVHFPIALLPVAVALDALVLWLPSQREWLDRAASVLYAATALGAAAAYWAGGKAADSLPPLALQVQIHVNEHADAARGVLWLVGFVALARIAVAFRDTTGRRKGLRILLFLLALGGVALVFRTADLGGGLVYQHGVGVAEGYGDGGGSTPGEGGKSEVQSSGAELAAAQLVEGEDGSLTWTPRPGDGEALGTLLLPAPGTDTSAVSWLEPAGGAEGLSLAVDGEALLLLPGAFGDVEVQVRLELEDFEGEVGLAHHVISGSRAGLLTVSFPGHEFVLASRDGARTRRLAGAVRSVPEGSFQLSVTAAGRHYYGFLGQERVVHGHEKPPSRGGCGLFLSGNGTVRILSLSVTPGSA